MSDTRRKRLPAALRTRFDNGENSHRGQNSQQRSRNNNSQAYQHGGYSRMNSSDKVRKIIQEEGRTARNLVIYNVPVQTNSTAAGAPQSQPKSDRSRSRTQKKSTSSQSEKGPQYEDPLKSSQKSLSDLTKSPKSEGSRKPDLRARYWKYLFDNLQRSVDAIYETCEQDESVVECKEVIMMLEQSTKDFKSLIERLHVQRAFDAAAKEGDRPASIAWEVRKMSPGKSAGMSQGHSSPSPAQRVLNFTPTEHVQNNTQTRPAAGNSWADRVKGVATSPKPQPASPSQETGKTTSKDLPEVLPSPPVATSPLESSITDTEENRDTDSEEEGWEMVHKKGKARQSPSQRSLENLSSGTPAVDRKLTRSISDPNAPVYRRQKKNFIARNKKTSPQQRGKGKGGEAKSETVPDSMRKRTNTQDSEKENRPKKSGPVDRTLVKTVSDGSPARSGRQVEDQWSHDSRSGVRDKRNDSRTGDQGGQPQSNKQPSDLKKKDMKSDSILESTLVRPPADKNQSHSSNGSNTFNTKPFDKRENKKQYNSQTKLLVNGLDSPATSSSEENVWTKRLNMKTGKSSDKTEKEMPDSKGVSDSFVPKLSAVISETETDMTPDSLHDSGVCDDQSEVFVEPSVMETINSVDNSFDSTSERLMLEKDEDVRVIDDALATAMDEEDSLTNQLEKEQDQALESAIQEEETWLKELAREENTQIEDDTETETESELSNTQGYASSLDTSQATLDWDSLVAEYDAAHASGSTKSWGEMVEEAELRTPGHAVHMHEKLSSPSRKRSPTESRKRHEEKQAKAQVQRERLMQEKAERLKDLSKKVEEVRAWKEELMRQKKGTIEKKMQQAEEKRQLQLKAKAQKAHEEEAKANEIAFINTLEAQNKRHDIMSKHQESEARLQDIQEERQRKVEEKLAKEAAVEERRKALQAERTARLQEMQERRKIRESRIEQQHMEKEKERIEALRAKEKEREERMAALNAQHEHHIQELQKKIRQKQDESSQRHQEKIQQIREKAFEMSVLRHSTEDHNDAPQITPYDQKKLCTICNALIPSEVYLLSHLRGKKHQQALKDNNSGKVMSKQEIESFNLKHIVNAPDNSTHPKIVSEKERLKSLKKRCKKLKQRMNTRGLEYENTLAGTQKRAESEHKAKMQKIIKDVNKFLQSQDKGPWPQNRVSALDRGLGEISRIFDKKVNADQSSFHILGGLTCLSRTIQVIDTSNPQLPQVIPDKSLVLTCTVFRQACKGCYDNCHYMLFSNKICVLIELLIHELVLMLPDDPGRPSSASTSSSSSSSSSRLVFNQVASSLMQLISAIFSCLAKHNPTTKSSEASMERMGSTTDVFSSRGNDVISYIISIGIVDKLTQYLRSVHGPIDEDRDAADFIQHSLGLLMSMTKFMSKRKVSIFDKKKVEDPTQLISTFEVTEAVGIVSLLYGMLLHSGTPSRGEGVPPEFPQHTLAVATTGLRMLNHMAVLDLHMLQKTLGDEGMSLEFRHIASYLIWYCSHHTSEELLHEVMLCVGYFTILNADNQVVIQSGQPPTVLQQMCSLPFQYFCDPKLTTVLFPTLIACCYNNQANREILEQELSCTLLSNFIEEKQLELQHARVMPSTVKEKEKNKEGDRMSLSARFPMEHWTAAQEYFKVSSD